MEDIANGELESDCMPAGGEAGAVLDAGPDDEIEATLLNSITCRGGSVDDNRIEHKCTPFKLSSTKC